MNASGIERPPVERLGGHAIFTQENFFTDQVLSIVDKKLVEKEGMTLGELSQAIETFGINATAIYAETINIDEFRAYLAEYMQSSNRFMIGNYYRPVINQKGGGHFSPIAAYDAVSDSILILDVARYKHTATWVDASVFFDSMKKVDCSSGLSRGLILVDSIRTQAL